MTFVGFYEIVPAVQQPSSLHLVIGLECVLGLFDGKHGIGASHIGNLDDFVVILGILG